MGNRDETNARRLYILTRQDLTPAQAVVQTAHALAEFMLKHGADP